MVDPFMIMKGHQHCAVDLKCEGCPYQKDDGDSRCIVNLLDDMKEYIEELYAAKLERDALAEEFQKIIQERQWIRAEDEKPPYNTYVKVWLTDRRELIAVYTSGEEWITEYFLEITLHVTHWMPLDEGPKEV